MSATLDPTICGCRIAGTSDAPKKLKFCVNGEWRETRSGRYMPVYNPSVGNVMAQTPCCAREEVEDAVKAAKAAFPSWSAKPVGARVQVMFQYKALLDGHLGELATLLSTEMGKNLSEARGDVLKAIEVVELACAVPVTMQGRSLMEVSTGHDTVSYREPMGVFVGIAPFNFPAMIPFGWMIPLAIATGNTFVLKAASMVPQTGMRMLELLHQAGLPAGVVNLVTCTRSEAEILLKDPDVRGVSFVGSTAVGRHVYATAAAHGKRVQCLTEAKNHGLVLNDAAIERAAQSIINSAFGCAGQRCMALPALCVEESVGDQLVECLVRQEYRPKNLVNSHSHRRLHVIDNGRSYEEPSFIAWHLHVPAIQDQFAAFPNSLLDPVRHPSFLFLRNQGSQFCLRFPRRPNPSLARSLEIMNGSEFANGSTIYTQSGYWAREFSRRTHGGMVGVNVGIPVPMSVFPFSGHKSSFFGDLHCMGQDGVAFYTETKSVTAHWFNEEETRESKVSTWDGTMVRT